MRLAVRARRRVTAAFALIGTILIAVGTNSPEAAATTTATAWTTVWADTFTGPAGTPPSSQWIVDSGHGYPDGPWQWGTGEVESASADPANLGLDGHGNLAITALRDAAGQWTSARIETVRSDFAPPAGGSVRFAARMALPTGGVGYWPAFWALGSTFRPDHAYWPGAGEVDVMEQIDSQRTVHGTLHCGTTDVGGPCDEDTGLTGVYPVASPAAFHTYALVWSDGAQRLQWSVDGHVYWSVSAATVGASTWADTFGHGYFLLLDLAIGGGWPGQPTSTTRSGGTLLVDYVSVATRPTP